MMFTPRSTHLNDAAGYCYCRFLVTFQKHISKFVMNVRIQWVLLFELLLVSYEVTSKGQKRSSEVRMPDQGPVVRKVDKSLSTG